MIKIVNLNKYYNKKKNNELHVINNTSLEIANTGLVTFLGASGAGKSTLLHVIGGLDRASGDIFYDDFNILKGSNAQLDKFRNSNIGYIFQNYNLLPNLTVYDNIKMQLDLLGVEDEHIIQKAIGDCLGLVNMKKYERRNITALSGGQQQRVAIARALVKGAKIIIADEPTGNLDSKNSIEIMNILKQLSKKILIVLVTHDRNLAKHYSDRIIEIVDGVITKDTINQNDDTLLHVDNNALYLDTYQKLTNNLENNKLQIYTNSNEAINLDIIIEQNTIYIQNNSSLPLKVIGENTDKYLMETAPKAEKIDENFQLISPINTERTHKKSKIWRNKLKQDLYNFFFNTNKRTKFLYISFILIGIILCLCFNSLNLCIKPDSNLFEDSSVNTLKVFPSKAYDKNVYGATFEKEEILKILDNETVLGVADYLTSITFDCSVIGSRQITASIKNHIYVTCNSQETTDYQLKDNEIIISNKLADSLINYLSPYGYTTYAKLKNLKLTTYITNYYNGEVLIKDVISTDNNSIILSDEIYFSNRNTTLIGNYIDYSVFDTTDVDMTDGFVAPSWLTPKSRYKALISQDLFEYFYYYDQTQDKYFTASDCFDIYGILPNAHFQIVFMSQEGYDYMVFTNIQAANRTFIPLNENKVHLVEGNYPQKDTEILLPYNTYVKQQYPIGSTLIQNKYPYTITGYFDDSFPDTTNYVYCSFETAYRIKILDFYADLLKKDNKEIDFYVSDYKTAKEFFEDLGYPAEITTDYLVRNNLKEKMLMSQITLSVTACIFVVMVVFIFFINRSKMIHNIYTIGVLRALGASKFKIISQYMTQSILLTTFTIAFGFTLMYCFSWNMNNFLTGFAFDFYMYVLIILGLYLLMLVAAIIPIASLLKKTPIEIISKYDI